MAVKEGAVMERVLSMGSSGMGMMEEEMALRWSVEVRSGLVWFGVEMGSEV